MNDLDQHIARLEEVLARDISVSDADAQAIRGRMDPHHQKMIEAIVRGIVPAVANYVAQNVLPVLKELREMRGRVSAIEDRGIKYCGIYQRVLSYQRGDVVTCDGSLWISTCATTGVKPGDGAAWVMITKSHGKAER